MAHMIGRNSEGEVVRSSKVLESKEPKEIVAFAKKAGLCAGFCIFYGVNPESKEVVEMVKSGYYNQKDFKPLLEQGYREWHYSWCWASDDWEIDGSRVKAKKIDMIKMKDAVAWGRALGYL